MSSFTKHCIMKDMHDSIAAVYIGNSSKNEFESKTEFEIIFSSGSLSSLYNRVHFVNYIAAIPSLWQSAYALQEIAMLLCSDHISTELQFSLALSCLLFKRCVSSTLQWPSCSDVQNSNGNTNWTYMPIDMLWSGTCQTFTSRSIWNLFTLWWAFFTT